MKETELRIGNISVDSNGVEVKIMELLTDYARVWVNKDEWVSVGCNYLNPVELTEEWLLKFGFEKDSEYIVGAGICWYFKHPDYKYKLSETFRLLLLGIDLKYVHQLQNLFFSLTEEDLMIKNE